MLLQLDGQGPRYAQITRALTAEIQNGALAPGARLPASRELARNLGCARNLVLLAYEQLVLEGYLVTRAGGGTYVSLELPVTPPPHTSGAELVEETEPSWPLSLQGRRITEIGERARKVAPRQRWPSIDFMLGLCEPDDRALARLRTAFTTTLRRRPFMETNASGEIGLRQQVAERLRGIRGISRKPQQVLVTSGVQQAVEICARLLINEGDRVVVEDPCYEVPPAQFAAMGAEVIPVPVDRHGLDVDRLPDDGKPVKLVYITPSHQFPTGAVMPVARRYALLAWAKRVGALIIEDDYDGEFRYAGRPIEALAALDPNGPVVYCGTFSKSFFPSLRLGYMVLPPSLMHAASVCRWLMDRGSSRLLQYTISELLATGEYDRHIRRMLRRYRSRCTALVDALERHLGTAVHVQGSEAGLHVAVWFPRLAHERLPDLIEACYARDVGVYPVARYAVLPQRRPGIVLGYGLIEVDQIREGVRRLADAYREVMRATRAAAPRRDRPRAS